jgi:hypothetical protein
MKAVLEFVAYLPPLLVVQTIIWSNSKNRASLIAKDVDGQDRGLV